MHLLKKYGVVLENILQLFARSRLYKKRLIFPQEIYATSLRPDIVIWSGETKQIVIAELTVPWEDRANTVR